MTYFSRDRGLSSSVSYHAAISVPGTENKTEPEARRTVLQRISTWHEQIKVFDGGRKEAVDCPETGIRVRSDYVRHE